MGTTNHYINIHVEEGDGFIDVSLESVKYMMECLLQGALTDFFAYKEDHENHENARVWLYEEDDDWDYMSLNTCCRILNLSKDRVRYMAQCEKDKGRTHFKAGSNPDGPNQFDWFLDLCRMETEVAYY